MNKFILTVILTAFTTVFSLGAVAADKADTNDNATHETEKEKWENKYEDAGKGNDSTSEIMQNEEAKDIPADEKYKYRDQEVIQDTPFESTEPPKK